MAILAILFLGVAGIVLFRVAAQERAHGVLLKWSPPAPSAGSTVVSYRIYRFEPDGSYGPIASGITAPTYVDRDVRMGATYHYVVKAVDAAGKESPPSNRASAKIR